MFTVYHTRDKIVYNFRLRVHRIPHKLVFTAGRIHSTRIRRAIVLQEMALDVVSCIIYLFIFNTAQFISEGSLLPSPTVSSGWLPIKSQAGDNTFMTIPHGLNQLPSFVQVITRAVDGPNDGFIFRAVGSQQRDDDVSEDYGGVIFSYNENYVRLWMPDVSNNHASGCAVYTGGSLWGTPHYQCSNDAEVKVDVWSNNSFPLPDYSTDWFDFDANAGVNSYKEITHGLGQQPAYVTVQYKERDGTTDVGFVYEGYGAAQADDDTASRHHGGIVFAYDEMSVRLWAPTNHGGPGNDGSLARIFDGWGGELHVIGFDDGLVKVNIWTDSFPKPQFESSLVMGSDVGVTYETIDFPNNILPEVVNVEVKAIDGANENFIFHGMGVQQALSGNNYGGVIYAYNEGSIRLWSPTNSNGRIINVYDGWGGETNTQRSTVANVTVKVWQTDNQDPCKEENYKEIDNRYRSSTFNTSLFSNVSELICDKDIEPGWYRFTSDAGGEIPTYCIDVGMCGTQYPVWIDGDIPDVDIISTVNVCINEGSCYDQQFPIRVKKCPGDYIVYELKRVPTCPMAYCAGEEEPCPPGLRSPTGDFQPGCSDIYPRVETPPILQHGTEELENLAYFECSFEAPNWKNTSYYIEWYLDDELVKTKYLNYRTNYHRLYEHEYQLGKWVTCEMSASFTEYGIFSPPLTSNDIFVGVQAIPNEVTVREDGSYSTVSITTTVPMDCTFQLKARGSPYGLPRPDIVFDRCQVDIGYENGDNDVMIYAIEDCQIEGFYTNKVDVIPVTEECSVAIREGYMETFEVRTEDVDCGNCCGTGDPHYTTYDKSYYDWYGEGDFVFHQSDTGHSEVHVRTWKCGSGQVTCHCAVAVRENNDVISIDMCDGVYGKTVPKVKKLSQQTFAKGVKVYVHETGKEFRVTLPSKRSLRATAGSTSLNVYLDVPGIDYEKSDGLCGTFDHNSENDFRKRDGTTLEYTGRRPDEFSESWRIPEGRSLFDTVPVQAYDFSSQNINHCSCMHGEDDVCNQDCGAPMDNSWVDVTEDIDVTYNAVRKRRNSFAGRDGVSSYSYNQDTSYRVTRSTPSSITEEQARRMCESVVLNSTAAEDCAKVPNVDLFAGVEGCVQDILLTEDLSFLYDAVDVMEYQCQEMTMKNLSLYTKDENGTVIAPPQYIFEVFCPFQCFGQGDCINGTCQCYAGYAGADCSIDMTMPPEAWFINDVIAHDLCDVREESCQSINLSGDNILNADSLVCLYKEQEGKEIVIPHIDSITVIDAQFRTYREVTCFLPNPMVIPGDPDVIEGVTVSRIEMYMSNDNGMTYSNGLLLTTYDSKCQHCNETNGCTLKDDACEINGHCFADGEYHYSDQTLFCDPSNDQYVWTQEPANQGMTWIAGVLIALVLCIMICLFSILVYRHLKKKTKLDNKVHPNAKDNSLEMTSHYDGEKTSSA